MIQIWSSWQGMGVLSMSALVSISCAAVLDRFQLIAGTEVHCHCVTWTVNSLDNFAPF